MGYLNRDWTIVGLGAIALGTGVLLGLTPNTRISTANAIPTVQPTPIPTPVPRLTPIDPPRFTLRDRTIFQQLLQRGKTERWDQQDLGTVTQMIGESFLGSEYKANLLDRSPSQPAGREQLIASLQQFDCVLFLETAIALAQTVQQPTQSPEQAEQTFFEFLQRYRYRNGINNDYCNRLHYFSDWISENDRRGLVQNMGKTLSGIPLGGSLSFMSQNWHKYPVLTAHPEFKTCIAQAEAQLNTQTVFYIPTQEIQAHYAQIQPGDVIGIVTSVPGLDTTHSGIAYAALDPEDTQPKRQKPTRIGLLHAAARSGVKISPDLQRFVSQVNGAIGIMIARPLPYKIPVEMNRRSSGSPVVLPPQLKASPTP